MTVILQYKKIGHSLSADHVPAFYPLKNAKAEVDRCQIGQGDRRNQSNTEKNAIADSASVIADCSQRKHPQIEQYPSSYFQPVRFPFFLFFPFFQHHAPWISLSYAAFYTGIFTFKIRLFNIFSTLSFWILASADKVSRCPSTCIATAFTSSGFT